jgi:hypothetical protein
MGRSRTRAALTTTARLDIVVLDAFPLLGSAGASDGTNSTACRAAEMTRRQSQNRFAPGLDMLDVRGGGVGDASELEHLLLIASRDGDLELDCRTSGRAAMSQQRSRHRALLLAVDLHFCPTVFGVQTSLVFFSHLFLPGPPPR